MILGCSPVACCAANARRSAKVRWLAVAGVASLAIGWLLGAVGICPVVNASGHRVGCCFSGGWCFAHPGRILPDQLTYGTGALGPSRQSGGDDSIAAYVMSWLFVGFIIEALLRHLGHHCFELLGKTYEPLVLGMGGFMMVEWADSVVVVLAQNFSRV